MWAWLRRLLGTRKVEAMMWTPAYSALLQRFVARFPVPQRRAGEPQEPDFEDRCRAWVKTLAEQFSFQYGSSWGVKSSSPGAPQSKDVLAHTSDQLRGWDMLVGAGTGFPTLNDPPVAIPDHEMKPQAFIPVTATNHLKEPQPDPEPEPEPEPIPGDLPSRVAALEARVAQYDAVVRALRAL